MASKKKRVFLTGASGFIGSHLVPSLVSDGWEVTTFIHHQSLPHALKGKNVKTIRGELGDLNLLRRCISKVDAICHAAAFLPPDYEDPRYAETCLQINGIATLRIAELAAELHKDRLIFFSSAQIYNASKKPMKEHEPCFPSQKATYYLGSKLMGELYVEHLRLLRQLPAVTLRIGACFGYGMPERSVVSKFMKRAYQNLPLEIFGGGKATADYVYVEDVAQLTLAALRTGAPGIYNAGS
ncbi:MAG: NAD(P)-dependent oxidoreductase, partial [Candidatus Omnitrophica bacterium]|nr:NAD(P)-dependent oxidoreductase [Candidatus Omnitrophota bacterium]